MEDVELVRGVLAQSIADSQEPWWPGVLRLGAGASMGWRFKMFKEDGGWSQSDGWNWMFMDVLYDGVRWRKVSMLRCEAISNETPQMTEMIWHHLPPLALASFRP
jgi:hypothetical protein